MVCTRPGVRYCRWTLMAAVLLQAAAYVSWRSLPTWDVPPGSGGGNCRAAWRAYSSYQQVTYLNPGSNAPAHSDFPCVHMRNPVVDPRRSFYETVEVLRLRDIIQAIVADCPSWKTLNKVQIDSAVKAGDFGNSSCVVSERLDELSKFKYLTRAMGDTLYYVSVLKDRIFPSVSRSLSCDQCFVYDFKNIILPRGVCEKKWPVEVVIIVTTVPRNFEERATIRRTWGSESMRRKYHFGIVFLFGTGWPEDQVNLILRENKLHNDILMDSFKDNYFNLTQKVLMGYHWVLDKCPSAKFVIRGADDTWIDIPAVFKLLWKFGDQETFQNYQVGDCFPDLEPFRGPDFKTFTNTLEYNEDIFPPYAYGTVFLTSRQLTRDLVDASPDVPFFPVEDVYFGLVLKHLGSGCHHIKGMNGNYTVHTPVKGSLS